MEQFKIHIEKDYQRDKLLVYLIEYRGKYRVSYTVSDGLITEHTCEDGKEYMPPMPIIEMPLRFGLAFLSALDDKMDADGINTRKADRDAGKLELLNEQLKFSQDSLTKFINHLTK